VFCANTEAPSSGSFVSASITWPLIVYCAIDSTLKRKLQASKQIDNRFFMDGELLLKR
jgi:hypothetical protein